MRLLNKLTILAIILSTLAGVASNLIIKWPEGYGLALLLVGCVATVSVNAAYEEWDKRRPKKEKLQEKAPSPVVPAVEPIEKNDPHALEVQTRPIVPQYCYSCGRKINPKDVRCLGCGQDLRPEKLESGVREVAGSTDLVVEDRKLPIKAFDFCNGLESFIDKELKAMDLRMEGARAMVAQGKISLEKFSEFIKQEEAEADELVSEADARLKRIEEWEEALNNRATYAKTQLDDAELESLRKRPEDVEVIGAKRNLFSFELKMVDKVLGWLGALETRIRVAKHSIESKLREAFLAAIPVRAMVPVNPDESAIKVSAEGKEAQETSHPY